MLNDHEIYVVMSGRTYAVDLVAKTVESKVIVANPDVGNKRCRWVNVTSPRIKAEAIAEAIRIK